MIALLFGLLVGPMQTSERVRVEVIWDGQDCSVSADGERLSMNDLEARSVRWAGDGRAASVFWAPDVPYRCIGGAIYLLQSGGVSEVASDWRGTAQVSITIPAGRCRIAVNGRPVTLARLRKKAAEWKEAQPQILRPKPNIAASIGCCACFVMPVSPSSALSATRRPPKIGRETARRGYFPAAAGRGARGAPLAKRSP